MKILFTGYTVPHCVGQMHYNKAYTQTHVYAECLKSLGHTVDKKRAIHLTDRDMAEYDIMFIGIAHGTGLPSLYRFPILAFLGKLDSANLLHKVRIFVDDWNFASYKVSHSTLYNTFEKRAEFDISQGRTTREFVDANKKFIMRGLDMVTDNTIETVVSIMNWSDDRSAYDILSTKLKFIDPSAYYPHTDQQLSFKGIPRAKQWVVAALRDYREYVNSLNLTWPVEYFGLKQFEDRRGIYGRTKESVVLEAYQRSVGMIVQTYNASFTNWWRPRYIFAARYGTIAYAQIGSTGKHTSLNVEPRIIENMSDYDLELLVEAQKQTIESVLATKEQCDAQMQAILAS